MSLQAIYMKQQQDNPFGLGSYKFKKMWVQISNIYIKHETRKGSLKLLLVTYLLLQIILLHSNQEDLSIILPVAHVDRAPIFRTLKRPFERILSHSLITFSFMVGKHYSFLRYPACLACMSLHHPHFILLTTITSLFSVICQRFDIN